MTVCAMLQLREGQGRIVRRHGRAGMAGDGHSDFVGSVSTTVYSLLRPVSAVGSIVTPAVSSSVTVTVRSAVMLA